MIVNGILWTLLYKGRKKILIIFVAFNLTLLIAIDRRNRHLRELGRNLKLTVEEIVQRNNYEPISGAGEEGKAVTLPAHLLLLAKQLKKHYFYNVLASDSVPINRSLPDMRNEICRFVDYDIEKLPKASVIIIFHNEAWSVIMRTVVSVMTRSPEKLLREIILVDDCSSHKYLGRELQDAVASYPKVRILRSKVRVGLIAARLLGAREAKAEVLVFLDAHCEVTIGWLEPLLHRAGSADVFVSSHIHIISSETLEHFHTRQSVGAFTWRLKFIWVTPDDNVKFLQADSPAIPYPTPAMSGGLFAVKKKLFWKLGGYDERMTFWGAENIEISLRAWQCGAKVEIAPCSIVGHIFKDGTAFGFNDVIKQKDIYTNLARTVLVWMDDYADFYFKMFPYRAVENHMLETSDRVELRKRLRCKSFKWYLDNVWPTNFFPTKDRWFGKIRNARGACLGVNPRSLSPASAVDCRNIAQVTNMYLIFDKGKLISEEGLCLETKNRVVIWEPCADTEKQIWERDGTKIKDKHFNHKACLMLVGDDNATSVGNILQMRMCKEVKGQIWNFEKVPW